MSQNEFVFTGLVLRQPKGYTALCPEIDVASEGRTIREAKQHLSEAVVLYLETAFENNLPHLRPVPPAEDPRRKSPRKVAQEFRVRITFGVKVHA